MKPGKQIIKLFLLGILAVVLFNFPLLSLSNKIALLFGIPQLYVYVFGVWFILLIFVFFIVENRSSENTKGKNHE